MSVNTETLPQRGDSFDQWLKSQRDTFPKNSHVWDVLDNVLDEYRLHADTGTPLDEKVCGPYSESDCN